MSESLGNYLLEMRKEHKNEMEKGLKTKYTGYWGELFALNYLENLLKRKNNIRNCNIVPHDYDYEGFDLEIYINNRRYKFEVKFSTIENYPEFSDIHFNNNFDYLFLIWNPSNEEIYFSILSKDEAKNIATEIHPGMNEDNWKIYTIKIFEKTNQNFLKKLSKFLELNEELEDLEENEKIDLIEDAKEDVIKEHPNAIRKDFSGITYQQWFFDYLSNYSDDVEPMANDDEYDIKYKEKYIEVKYSSLHDGETSKFFKFEHIKPNLFHFIFLIGFDDEENKFYFSIKTREEVVEIKKELAGSDDFYSQNGFTLNVGKHSILNFVNDFTFEDFDNYIESH